MKAYEQIFKYAMQMEMDGYNFYKEKSSSLNNPTSVKTFQSLADAEKDHYKYLENQFKNYMDTDSYDLNADTFDFFEDENEFEIIGDSEHLDDTLKESDIPDITILRMAYLIERDYKEFYQKAAEDIEDENIKAIFEKLSKWEQGHETMFKSEYDKRMKEYMSLPWGG
jgi:rubrerythrin